MWLKLDLDGINFDLRIRGYKPTTVETIDFEWCNFDLSLISGSWLNYKANNKLLLSYEVQTIFEALDKLLNNKVNEIIVIDPLESDYKLEMYSKKDLHINSKHTQILMNWIVCL